MRAVTVIGLYLNDQSAGPIYRVTGLGYELTDHPSLEEAQAAAEGWLKA